MSGLIQLRKASGRHSGPKNGVLPEPSTSWHNFALRATRTGKPVRLCSESWAAVARTDAVKPYGCRRRTGTRSRLRKSRPVNRTKDPERDCLAPAPLSSKCPG